jgi:hypothetical protein
MRSVQEEEFKHFSMDVEVLLRRAPWREIAERILFKPGRPQRSISTFAAVGRCRRRGRGSTEGSEQLTCFGGEEPSRFWPFARKNWWPISGAALT